MSFRLWVLIAAEMMSLTGGSSFIGADEGSLEVVFFTFGAVFSPDLGLMVLRRRGFRTFLDLEHWRVETFCGLPMQLASCEVPGS